jgi:hypothetical protein
MDYVSGNELFRMSEMKILCCLFRFSQKPDQELLKLPVQQASISISEPPESPISSNEPIFHHQQSVTSANPSPPPPTFAISPGSPPASPVSNELEEKDAFVTPNHSHPATIAEEQHEQDDGIVMNKSSLSLPFEQSPTTPTIPGSAQANSSLSSGSHVKVSLPERSQSDRRKLSVTNIMSFSERRRSTSSIFSEMRKMSITNFDNLKSPGVGK